MELFSFEFAGKKISLVGSAATGEAQVFVDGSVASSARAVAAAGVYEFALQGRDEMRLSYQFDVAHGQLNYSLYQGEQLLLRESAPIPVATQSAVQTPSDSASGVRGHTVSLLGIVFKLFKSATVVKVALAGASLAAWSMLFSWQFALVLIAVFVYSRIRSCPRYAKVRHQHQRYLSDSVCRRHGGGRKSPIVLA